MGPDVIILGIVAAVVLIVVAVTRRPAVPRNRSEHLRKQFGPE